MRSVRLIFALLVIPWADGCGEEAAAPPRYPFTFTANADGEPIAGVVVVANEQTLGETNSEGVLRRDLTGPSGAPVTIRAQCPAGHRSPTEPQVQTLRPVMGIDPATTAQGIQVSFECPPEFRDAVVVVRTGDREGLPIYVDGTEVTRTDSSGTAHVAMHLAPHSTFEVRIATNLVNERLQPSAPSRSFTVPDEDHVFVYEQEFEEPPAPRRRRARAPAAAPAARLPIRIGSH